MGLAECAKDWWMLYLQALSSFPGHGGVPRVWARFELLPIA